MPHHLTSFVAALTGSVTSGTCCGCIPFSFSSAVSPAVASSTAPLSAAIPNTAIPAAVASQSAVSSTPVLTSVMAFFAPLLAFYKKYNIFEETNNCSIEKVDKMCQCNFISSDDSYYLNKDIPSEEPYFGGKDNYKQRIDNNENITSDSETMNRCNLNGEEMIKEDLESLSHEKSLTSSIYSTHSFLDDTEQDLFKNSNNY
ncbi:hypothetical protein, conserved [Plasmodium gonderi]|uniref:Variable surface protein n=1 Tax=Plasmodium gonderi TaxID=77519 RepID=A0A1Y1JP98_PLAGO|nr:hypothetical protein, conserved [Plasmodium gonderi]GAW83265.1 hypothetical protein, conserved [Plasmodium gonderi]